MPPTILQMPRVHQLVSMSAVDDHAHRARRGAEEQQAVDPGDVVGHQQRAALLGEVLALVDADAVEGVRGEPGEEFDRGLRDQEDDVDEDGNRGEPAEEEDLSRGELDADGGRTQEPVGEGGDQHAAEGEEIAGRQDRAAVLRRALVLHERRRGTSNKPALTPKPTRNAQAAR